MKLENYCFVLEKFWFTLMERPWRWFIKNLENLLKMKVKKIQKPKRRYANYIIHRSETVQMNDWFYSLILKVLKFLIYFWKFARFACLACAIDASKFPKKYSHSTYEHLSLAGSSMDCHLPIERKTKGSKYFLNTAMSVARNKYIALATWNVPSSFASSTTWRLAGLSWQKRFKQN